MKIKELEKRLRDEPENLGLRITVASALREAGRAHEAIELYRSVAIAYQDQGRTQQAIACCRSILEIAPNDERCHKLLGTLVATTQSRVATPPKGVLPAVPPPAAAPPPAVEPAPNPTPRPPILPADRPSAMDQTPLPTALPYHVADPTTGSLQRISDRISDSDLPPVESSDTRPGYESGVAASSSVTGIAAAARRISAQLIGYHDEDDIAVELDTRERPKIESAEFARIALPPPTVEVVKVDPEDVEEPATRDTSRDGFPKRKSSGANIDTEEETRPRDLPIGSQATHAPVLATAFFQPLPRERREAVLNRFFHRRVPKTATIIRQGESGHAFVLIVDGRVEIRGERAGGFVTLATLSAGEFVGESALLARTPAPAHVVAITDAELLLLPPPDFYEIANTYPALLQALKASAERRRF